MNKLLIANRGEIAIRIINAACDLEMETVTIYSEDDKTALHTKKSEESYPLKGSGAAAYLDITQIIDVAKKSGCNYLHPGYGFLSENAQLAKACAAAGIIFVGPNSKTLKLFGNKIKARAIAKKVGIPLIPGTNEATSLKEVKGFFKSLPEGSKIMIKSMAGGGGRGMRIVSQYNAIEKAYQQCQSEAQKAFGNDQIYVEKYLPKARHIEVQILGDGEAITHLWERECSLQRRQQKLIEIAPCPEIHPALRQQIIEAAIQLAKAVNYENAGTFEFLVEGTDLSANIAFYFLEVNPRIQVEHTVTEEITGVDIVKFQLNQAMGYSLKDLGLKQSQISAPIGFAIQARINMETIDNQGNTLAKTGQLTHFDVPFGKGIRVETSGYVGYANSPSFDTLLAKLIIHSKGNNYQKAIKKLYRKIGECRIEGIGTNLPFLQNILQQKQVVNNQFHTQFILENLPQLLATPTSNHPQYYFKETQQNTAKKVVEENLPVGIIAIKTPMPGSVVSIDAKVGKSIKIGQQLIVIEAMKMESVILAETDGVIEEIKVKKGAVLFENDTLFLVKKIANNFAENTIKKEVDLDKIRPELKELQIRKAFQLDENRPIAVAKRKKKGKQTARENIAQLCDADTFLEYGSLIVAAQRSRRKLDDLVKKTPADGIITGIGEINGDYFEAAQAKCMVLCYDYTVLAGTQGMFGHQKTDRVLEVAHSAKLPIILFAEGGGGRPGDTDFQGIGGLHVKTFAMFAKHNGIAPRIAIVSGYCFAGNAALAGCADVIIATKDTSIGMGGPAMIEGGGLGKYHPKEVGPVEVQGKNGVLDVIVKDEKAAILTAKKYLSYFQGSIKKWACENQRTLRHLIPENRRRVYDIRQVIQALADKDSVLELRKEYAIGVIPAFIRIEGQPMGLIANNPKHLGGALDAEGSGKAARFMQLCDVYRIPMVSLCDTPGFMVGPEAEKTGLVRHTSRLFTTGAKISIPFFTIVLRKAYGLGSMGMAAGGMHEPFFTVSWPTGEFGGMGLEGAVRLGYRKELEAIEDLVEREALFQKMVAKSYKHGKAINTGAFLEIDEVIDPMDTRKWIVNGLLSNAASKDDGKAGRGFVDTW
ncbi:MAG: carboxyl transferase domain-containing protein [Saprospiraceae bacterium]